MRSEDAGLVVLGSDRDWQDDSVCRSGCRHASLAIAAEKDRAYGAWSVRGARAGRRRRRPRPPVLANGTASEATKATCILDQLRAGEGTQPQEKPGCTSQAALAAGVLAGKAAEYRSLEATVATDLTEWPRMPRLDSLRHRHRGDNALNGEERVAPHPSPLPEEREPIRHWVGRPHLSPLSRGDGAS